MAEIDRQSRTPHGRSGRSSGRAASPSSGAISARTAARSIGLCRSSAPWCSSPSSPAVIAPHSPDEQFRDALAAAAGLAAKAATWTFLLGTDAVGRDILSRLIYGARYSLFIGAVVVTLALVGGVALGLVAGFFRGCVDTVIMRVMDIILAFPSLLLALVLVADPRARPVQRHDRDRDRAAAALSCG